MRATFSIVGNLLVIAGLAGLVPLAVDPTGGFFGLLSGPTEAAISAEAATAPGGAEPSADGPRPITRAVIPRIALDTVVESATLLERDGGTTWEVPAFRAGHAQHTAGAGQLGNAVLLGHVSSRNAGNVFKDLGQVQAGDLVNVFSGSRQFNYRVVDVRSVSRTDVSVVQSTETASLSLITCTGLWLPFTWDYAERLVVRAELIPPADP